jgi:hypothetical protein
MLLTVSQVTWKFENLVISLRSSAGVEEGN